MNCIIKSQAKRFDFFSIINYNIYVDFEGRNPMEEKIKELLLEKTECEAIVLFGSYARGTQNSESDIDIAIKTKNKIDKKTLYKIFALADGSK